ncbi:hypothetical protein LSTR_LSTR004601 [Laodelphax striatellus]|uniref:RDD domain-containing protein n=1 Tax=Laodelphax striatellus TaxID=195883 RepID=A0A482WTT2_LAOST|nr:hypothetical protein LSTR_LSTR004601 [Laodelphax striatellus]
MTAAVDEVHPSTNEDKTSANNTSNSKSNEEYSTEKYFQSLEKWLQEAYMWQSVTASFPYFLWYNHCAANQISPSLIQNSAGQFPYPNLQNLGNNNQNTQFQNTTIYEGIECKVPPLWKRLTAEFLDFIILFLIKLLVMFIAIDFVDMIDVYNVDFDLERIFDYDILQKEIKLDYKVAMQMVIWEMVHRVLVCAFETLWLAKSVGGRIGGATPGKTVMGLCVVRCDTITTLRAEDDVLLVKPGTDPGLRCAFFRSFVKNLVLAFFLPANFFSRVGYNRTIYDTICKTIVVEEAVRHRRPHQN